MTESDKSAIALRMMLTRDFDQYKQLLRSFDRDEGRDFLRLVATAFLKMADRKFGSGEVTVTVVEWIAKIRSESEVAAKAIDPALSEQALLYVLGKSDGEELSGRQIRDAALLLLPLLVEDQHLNGAGIYELLRAARSLADR